MTVSNCLNIHDVSNSVVVGTGSAFNSISYSTTPTPSSFCERDSNANLSSNFLISAYTTTAKAVGTTTLTVSSTQLQYFTGASAQTVVLPVTSTLVLGQTFTIVNISTSFPSNAAVTVNSSGGNTISIVTPGSSMTFTCILTSGTTAASWSSSGPNIKVSQISGGIGISTSGTPANITSLSLTPGAYLLRAILCLQGANISSISLAINTTSASVSGTLGLDLVTNSGLPTAAGSTTTIFIPALPVVVSTTTTWFMNGVATFTGASGGGGITFFAQRVA